MAYKYIFEIGFIRICRKALSLLEQEKAAAYKREEFLEFIFSVLDRISAVGINFLENDALQDGFQGIPLAEPSDIKVNSSIHVVKMLHSYMNIKVNNSK